MYSFEHGYECLPTMRGEVVREQDLSVWLAQDKGTETTSARESVTSCVLQDLRHPWL